MNEYEGAVAYIDLLGIGALTSGAIPLVNCDIGLLSKKYTGNNLHHAFAARLLVLFRRALVRTQQKYPSVRVAQLSDAAFLWSRSPIKLLDASRYVMWTATKYGLLCRGGLSYGNIVEPNKVNKQLGQFVLGSSATKAVTFERSGKGCRLFSDNDLPSALSSELAHLNQPFIGLKNPLDGSVVDEFRWYYFPDSLQAPINPKKSNRKRAIHMMELISLMWLSPKYRWNIATKSGQIHVASSIESISHALHPLIERLDYRYSSEFLIGGFVQDRDDVTFQKVLSTRIKEINKYFDRKIS